LLVKWVSHGFPTLQALLVGWFRRPQLPGDAMECVFDSWLVQFRVTDAATWQSQGAAPQREGKLGLQHEQWLLNLW